MKKTNGIHLLQACPQWVEKLNAIHRDDLPFEEWEQLRRHLEICANCRAVKAEYCALDALITDLSPVASLPTMPARLHELINVRAEIPTALHKLSSEKASHPYPAPRDHTSGMTPAHQQNDEQTEAPFNSKLLGVCMKFPRVGKLASVHEAAVSNLLSTEAEVPATISSLQTPERPQQRSARTRRSAATLNMVAALLVISALIAGFLMLSSSHRSKTGIGSGRPMRPQTLIQHNTYLDVIIGNAHGDTYAVEPQTGTIVWKHQVMSAPGSFPFAAYGIFYYPGMDHTLYAIDGGTGQALWHRRLTSENQDDQFGWTFAASNNLVFVTSTNSNTGSQTLYALHAYTGTIAWQKHFQGKPQDDLVLVVANGVLYGAGREFYAWSTKDGHQLWFNPKLSLAFELNPYYPSLIVSHGKLYFFQDSVLRSIQIAVVDASSGQFLHAIAVSTVDPQPVSLVVSGDALYAAMDSGKDTPSIWAYGLSDEQPLWHKSFKDLEIVSMSITGERIYLGTNQGFLALKRSDGSQLWLWSDTMAVGPIIATVEINGVVCVIDGSMAGVRVSDGHKLWRTTFSQTTSYPPVID